VALAFAAGLQIASNHVVIAHASVSTIAGSGLSGNLDGRALDAQFVMPAGLAEDGSGNLYIADAGGQRIRQLTNDGFVRTVAGSGELVAPGLWVPGGYRDGPASSAQFNHPSGIAVGPDGALYVADTLNHCIRKILNQQVTTFAGRPPFSGHDDGERANATFDNPRALAFSEDGTLYVADDGNGLRRISPQGVVETVRLPTGIDRRIGGMAVIGAGASRVIFLSTWNALLKLDSELHPLWMQKVIVPAAGPRLFNEVGELRKDAIRESRRPLGHPFSVAALDANGVLYTDLHTHSIGYFVKQGARSIATIVTRWPIPDAANRAGGYRDGALSSAEFDAPLGILHRKDGSFVVADSGNRRLRAFDFDPREPSSTPPPVRHLARSDSPLSGEINLHVHLVPRISSRYYRIAFLANSYGYWDTRWDESIESLVEKRLNEDRLRTGLRKRVKVALLFPYFETLDSVAGYAREVLSHHTFDAVVWQVNQQTVALQFAPRLSKLPPASSPQDLGAAFARVWQPRLTASLKSIKGDLSRGGVSFFVVLHPIGLELTPLEDAELEEFEEPFYPTNGFSVWSQSGMGAQLNQTARAAGVRLIDAYPQFEAAERSAFRKPLYGTLDEHFSREGRALLARIIAEQLEAARPWAHESLAPNAKQRLHR